MGLRLKHTTKKKPVAPRKTGKNDAAPASPDLDLQAWINALRALPAAAVTEADVLAWTEGPLRNFFPFERFLGAYGNLSGGRIQMRSLVSSGHAPDFLAGLEEKFDLKSRGCFAWWVSNRKAFILDKDGALDEAGVAITPPGSNSKRSTTTRSASSRRTASSTPLPMPEPISAFQACREHGRSEPWRRST